jgi:hypothetical protein
MPTVFVMLLVQEALNLTELPHDIAPLYEKFRDSDLPRGIKLQKIMLALFLKRMQDYEEYTTRLIDFEVLSRLGYRVIPPFQEPRGEVIGGYDPILQAVIMIPQGDPLYGYSVAKRLEVFRNWVENFKPSNAVQQQLAMTLGRVKVEKVRLRDLEK